MAASAPRRSQAPDTIGPISPHFLLAAVPLFKSPHLRREPDTGIHCSRAKAKVKVKVKVGPKAPAARGGMDCNRLT